MLTALIPTHNDGYTLWLCLHSIAPHFEEIIVLDDYSIDETEQVVEKVRTQYPHIRYEKVTGQNLGPVDVRLRLFDMARGDHLFCIDADDVLCEYNAHLLWETTKVAPVVHLQLVEMWGDFEHTTQRLEHYDPCHIYINKNEVIEFGWEERGGTGYPVYHSPSGAGPGPLFWHIKGVKPDWRLVERPFFHNWKETGNLHDCLLGVPEEEIHKRSIERLLHNGQDVIQRYQGKPRRPKVIESAQPRFEIIYRDGKPVDRIDHGWWASDGSLPDALRFGGDLRSDTEGWDNFVPKRPGNWRLREKANGTVQLKTPGGTAVEISPTARLVWGLCNGEMTIGAIKHSVIALYGNEAATDVLQTINEFAHYGLITLKKTNIL